MTATLDRPGTRVAPADTVPVARLVLVELRKLADTRSGRWLLIIIGLATAGTSAIQLGWADDSEMTFERLFGFGLVPSAALLPVLGILSMTGEWSQRTALTTFTLVPARSRVIGAKLAAGVLIGFATTVVTAVLAAAANLLSAPLGGDGSWHIAPTLLGQSALVEIIYVLMGMGFGALLLNSPLAIVTYFALPTLWSVLTGVIKRLDRIAGWLDLNTTTSPLYEPHMGANQYGRLGTSVALWVVLPLILGTIRILRREVS